MVSYDVLSREEVKSQRLRIFSVMFSVILCYLAMESDAWSTPNQYLRGKVQEVVNAGDYTFIRMKTGSGETWVAVPPSPVPVGGTINVLRPNLVTGFRSESLGKKFDRIYFGLLDVASGSDHSSHKQRQKQQAKGSRVPHRSKGDQGNHSEHKVITEEIEHRGHSEGEESDHSSEHDSSGHSVYGPGVDNLEHSGHSIGTSDASHSGHSSGDSGVGHSGHSSGTSDSSHSAHSSGDGGSNHSSHSTGNSGPEKSGHSSPDGKSPHSSRGTKKEECSKNATAPECRLEEALEQCKTGIMRVRGPDFEKLELLADDMREICKKSGLFSDCKEFPKKIDTAKSECAAFATAARKNLPTEEPIIDHGHDSSHSGAAH